MKLVPYNGKLGGFYKNTGNYEIVKEFMDSGMKCAEIEDFPQKDAKTCVQCIRGTIKRYRLFNVRATVRDNRVFLIRDEI